MVATRLPLERQETMNGINEQKQRLEHIEGLSKNIDEAFKNEDWDGVETALEDRNASLPAAFPDDLATELYDYAREVYQQACLQQDELILRAKELQKSSGTELRSQRKNLDSIKAYQQN